MRKKMKGPISLREILPQALKDTAIDNKTAIYQLQEKWSDWVGPLLGKKSIPLKIHGKRLFVGVAGSCWANELEFLKQPLLEKISESCPAINLDEIRFQITEVGKASFR